MGKLFVFQIPAAKIMRKYSNSTIENGVQITRQAEEPLRNLYKGILTTLFTLASSTKKQVAEALQCQDSIDQIKNLDDKETVIKFTDQDVKFLSEGFEMTAGVDEYGRLKRPSVWLSECRSLFEAINKPVSEEGWLKEQAEKKKK